MKKLILTAISCIAFTIVFAQTTVDSTESNEIIINKDPRLNTVAKNEAQINDANGVLLGAKAARGYRLMLLNTNNKDVAIKLRAQLLQNFPEQKVYMSFQPPYIKVKFGDFLDKDEAEDYKTQIANDKIVLGNIYIVPDLVELKQDKTASSSN
jgi:hypothetical protein